MRPLYQIATEIAKDWKKPTYGAIPYLDAMAELDSIYDSYYLDSARSIVAYFLSNASGWRGEKKKKKKKELNQMLSESR